MKTRIELHKLRYRIGAGGGTRTLFSYLARPLKQALAAETHNGTSRQLSVTDAKVCPVCAHGARLCGCFPAPPRQGGTRPT
jgi:hypothetical protein